MITAALALIPLGTLGISAWNIAFPAEAELFASPIQCSANRLSVAIANAGESVGVIQAADFSVIRSPDGQVPPDQDSRDLVAEKSPPPVKPSDVVVVDYAGRIMNVAEHFPEKGQSSSCLYRVTVKWRSVQGDDVRTSAMDCSCVDS